MFGWLKYRPKLTPEQLHKKKEDEAFIEAIKRSAIIRHGDNLHFSLENLGMSEYGARKHLEEGTEPAFWERVLLEDGNLISWQEWKEKYAQSVET